MHSDVEDLYEKFAVGRTPLCHTAGFCLCGPEGACARSMHRQFMRALTKRFSRKRKRDRKNLVEANIVVALIGTRIVHADDEAKDNYAEYADAEIWLHIGWQAFKPVSSIFHVLHADYPGTLGNAVEAVKLRGKWSFATSWQQFHEMDKQLFWSMRLFELSNSRRVLGSVTPADVLVEELAPWPSPDDLEVQFWDGPNDAEKAPKAFRRRIHRRNRRGKRHKRKTGFASSQSSSNTISSWGSSSPVTSRASSSSPSSSSTSSSTTSTTSSSKSSSEASDTTSADDSSRVGSAHPACSLGSDGERSDVCVRNGADDWEDAMDAAADLFCSHSPEHVGRDIDARSDDAPAPDPASRGPVEVACSMRR